MAAMEPHSSEVPPLLPGGEISASPSPAVISTSRLVSSIMAELCATLSLPPPATPAQGPSPSSANGTDPWSTVTSAPWEVEGVPADPCPPDKSEGAGVKVEDSEKEMGCASANSQEDRTYQQIQAMYKRNFGRKSSAAESTLAAWMAIKEGRRRQEDAVSKASDAEGEGRRVPPVDPRPRAPATVEATGPIGTRSIRSTGSDIALLPTDTGSSRSAGAKASGSEELAVPSLGFRPATPAPTSTSGQPDETITGRGVIPKEPPHLSNKSLPSVATGAKPPAAPCQLPALNPSQPSAQPAQRRQQEQAPALQQVKQRPRVSSLGSSGVQEVLRAVAQVMQERRGVGSGVGDGGALLPGLKVGPRHSTSAASSSTASTAATTAPIREPAGAVSPVTGSWTVPTSGGQGRNHIMLAKAAWDPTIDHGTTHDSTASLSSRTVPRGGALMPSSGGHEEGCATSDRKSGAKDEVGDYVEEEEDPWGALLPAVKSMGLHYI